MQPFVNWDQTDITAEEYKEKCGAIDFGYYDFKAGQVSDWEAFEKFLTATVERYDGDGKNDMPGLTTRVEAWEIGNEIEGSCGGFSGDPEGYIELLSASYRIIKEADPTAIVLNGGALEVLGFDGQNKGDRRVLESFSRLAAINILTSSTFIITTNVEALMRLQTVG